MGPLGGWVLGWVGVVQSVERFPYHVFSIASFPKDMRYFYRQMKIVSEF